MHLEICLKDLQEDFMGVELKISEPVVSFRETVSVAGAPSSVPFRPHKFSNCIILILKKDVRSIKPSKFCEKFSEFSISLEKSPPPTNLTSPGPKKTAKWNYCTVAFASFKNYFKKLTHFQSQFSKKNQGFPFKFVLPVQKLKIFPPLQFRGGRTHPPDPQHVQHWTAPQGFPHIPQEWWYLPLKMEVEIRELNPQQHHPFSQVNWCA